MLIHEMEHILPDHWTTMDVVNEKFKFVKLSPYHVEYEMIKDMMRPQFYSAVQGIYRIQNPCLYTKFRLKQYDFEQKGLYDIKTLFHDTSRDNVISIASFNFDWRYGNRFMFGPGVYFSTNPFLANKHSSKTNGEYRTMFVVQVLTQNIQRIDGEVFLPDYGYDTTLCHNDETYVKYFDNEYYPQYSVDYIDYRC